MADWRLAPELLVWVQQLSWLLHARVGERLLPLVTGALFAQGRRTVAAWLRVAGVGREYRLYYYFLGSLGRNVKSMAGALLRQLVDVVALGERIVLALDDSPTKRYGPQVEGAGIHHNPTPGPADHKFVYGHVWVTLALVARHAWWGTIGLPLLALLYVRRKDIAKLPSWYGIHFRTKLELAVELVAWAALWLRFTGKSLWLVADGAYAKRPFLLPVLAAGVTVVSRLRKDSALWTLPAVARKRQVGRPRIYGKEKISLAKRAAHRHGWQTDTFTLYGRAMEKTYKTFLATSRLVSGVIRVVLVKEEQSWVAFFCTDPDAEVEQILEAVADRAAIEQVFHDVKEVHGAGQQQLRNYWANLAAFNLTLWLHTLIEMWAWSKPHKQLVDRRHSPWDQAERRPSHADRRNALRRQCLQEEFSRHQPRAPMTRKFKQLWNRLLKLAAL